MVGKNYNARRDLLIKKRLCKLYKKKKVCLLPVVGGRGRRGMGRGSRGGREERRGRGGRVKRGRNKGRKKE